MIHVGDEATEGVDIGAGAFGSRIGGEGGISTVKDWFTWVEGNKGDLVLGGPGDNTKDIWVGHGNQGEVNIDDSFVTSSRGTEIKGNYRNNRVNMDADNINVGGVLHKNFKAGGSFLRGGANNKNVKIGDMATQDIHMGNGTRNTFLRAKNNINAHANNEMLLSSGKTTWVNSGPQHWVNVGTTKNHGTQLGNKDSWLGLAGNKIVMNQHGTHVLPESKNFQVYGGVNFSTNGKTRIGNKMHANPHGHLHLRGGDNTKHIQIGDKDTKDVNIGMGTAGHTNIAHSFHASPHWDTRIEAGRWDRNMLVGDDKTKNVFVGRNIHKDGHININNSMWLGRGGVTLNARSDSNPKNVHIGYANTDEVKIGSGAKGAGHVELGNDKIVTNKGVGTFIRGNGPGKTVKIGDIATDNVDIGAGSRLINTAGSVVVNKDNGTYIRGSGPNKNLHLADRDTNNLFIGQGTNHTNIDNAIVTRKDWGTYIRGNPQHRQVKIGDMHTDRVRLYRKMCWGNTNKCIDESKFDKIMAL